MNSARPLALLLVFVSGASLAAESGAGAVERLLDDNFAGYSERGEPGVAAMVIENGAIRLQRTYGVADIQRRNPITPDTAFRLASVSKQFAAMAVMILAEDGKLDYDDPVSRFVPELAPYEGVTVRNLLQHTGGLPDYYDVIDTSKGMPTNEDAARLLGELASPEFPPGDRYAYSNPGYDMLGPLVEAAAGKPFVLFVKERIFDAAGMTASLVHDHNLPFVANRATGYDVVDGEIVEDDADPLNGIVGSGGIYTTLNDMFRWDQALYGEDLVSQDTLELAYTSGVDSRGESIDYGFGWRIGDYRGHRRVSHGGSWVGFRTHIIRIPGLRFTVVLLSNRGDFDSDQHANAIVDAWFGASPAQAKSAAP